jgi:hypothetical protein
MFSPYGCLEAKLYLSTMRSSAASAASRDMPVPQTEEMIPASFARSSPHPANTAARESIRSSSLRASSRFDLWATAARVCSLIRRVIAQRQAHRPKPGF